jgi:hypothetical protein
LYLEDTQELNRDTSGEFARELEGAIGIVLGAPTADEDKGCCGGGTDPLDGWEFNPETGEVTDDDKGRWVDLDQFLDGTYSPPTPSVGAARGDGVQLMYPAMWHTGIGLTTAGKTSFALWHVKAVLDAGGHVVYIHFEEATPNGIIHRLKGLGVEVEVIRKQFHFGNIDTAWKLGEMAAELIRLNQTPTLAVLDGINAACGMQGWQVKEPESVGEYRAMFVHPLTSTGCTVLSLGHPPKDMKRQDESYSYGAAGWLNDVDGASYWLTANKESPITKGDIGFSNVCLVKDRYGEVQRHGVLNPKEMAQWYIGAFTVIDNNTGGRDTLTGEILHTEMHMTVPTTRDDGTAADEIDHAADTITAYLKKHGPRFKSKNGLTEGMRAQHFSVSQGLVAPALERLCDRDVIEWPQVEKGARPGWLKDSLAWNPDTEEDAAEPEVEADTRDAVDYACESVLSYLQKHDNGKFKSEAVLLKAMKARVSPSSPA